MRSGDALRRDVLRMASNAAYNVEKQQAAAAHRGRVPGRARRARSRPGASRSTPSATAAARTSRQGAGGDRRSSASTCPQPLTEDELRALVDEAHRRDRRDHARDLGKVMGWLSPAHPRPRRRQGRQRARRPGARPGRSRRPRRRQHEPRDRPMLTQRSADPPPSFTRHDAGRFLVAAVLLVVVLSAILAVDILPQRCLQRPGRRPRADATSSRRAPLDLHEPGPDRRAPARPPATASRPSTTTRRQGDRRRRPQQARAVRRGGHAGRRGLRAVGPRSSDRAALLKDVLPGLPQSEARRHAPGTRPDRWTAIRAEASRDPRRGSNEPSCATPTSPSARARLARAGSAAASTERRTDARRRAHRARSSSPTPRSARPDDQASAAAAAAAVPPVSQCPDAQGQVDRRARATAIDAGATSRRSSGFGLNDGDARLRAPRRLVAPRRRSSSACCWPGSGASGPSSGTATTCCCSSACCSSCSATFALKLTAGRAVAAVLRADGRGRRSCSRSCSTRRAAMLVTALLAVIAGAVNGSSLEFAAYTFLGGLAGIVAVRRGDRLQRLRPGRRRRSSSSRRPGRDRRSRCSATATSPGVLQLWVASAAVAPAARRSSAVGTFAVLGQPVRDPDRVPAARARRTRHSRCSAGCSSRRPARTTTRSWSATSPSAPPRRSAPTRCWRRVAAYYHDVGKLANPLAFIENQAGGENVHDELEPEASAPDPQEPRRRRHRHRLQGAACPRRSSRSSRSTTGRRS